MYFKQAKDGENEWWMYLVTVLLLLFGYGVGQLPLLWVQSYALENHSDIGTAEVDRFAQTLDFSILHIDNNLGILLMFTIFIGATLFFLLAVKFIHKKSLKGLITHNYRISWTKVFFGLVVWLALLSIFELILYFVSPETYYLKANWDKVFILLLICITVLPIQTTLEELFFRSYVMKGIGLIARSKWIPLIITSLLFGLVHSSNPEISKYGMVPMQLYYISAGLLLGIITIMDDGLELAIGVHAATNIYGALFVCYDGSVLQTDSIWHVTDINAWIMAIIFVVSGIIFLLLSKKIFDWAAWSKLTEEIKK
ncbi:MAG: lysostaphin resistance A-like protein [Saprospiraceae bacterium]|nr:lysostaphin resistance A-like protein [Saprospiraceae bacterium]